jgi:hypothetical protein
LAAHERSLFGSAADQHLPFARTVALSWLGRVEFEEHGMNSLVKLRHRNVCKDGFDLEGEVDAGLSFLFFYFHKVVLLRLIFLPM